VIERLDEAFLKEVGEKSNYLFRTFGGAKGIKSVSGKGLMIGLETERPAAEVVRECMENGVLCLTAKTKVRLLPALNIPMNELKRAADVILKACAQ
jgi:acetylornithine/N-succinyldiaminopimelate aminotransferase